MNGSGWSYEDAVRSANNSITSVAPTFQAPPVMPAFTTSRNVSGPLGVDSAAVSNENVNTNSNTTPGASPWNHMNPHATPTNSKTSQYIDKITSENERLRRELRAERLAREDEAKRVSAAKSKAEDSRAEHQHLQVLADANARAIERKDRKIDELKAALETEAKRRQAAESRAEEALKMLGDTRSETQRQLATAYELMHRADASADAAKSGYDRKVEGFKKQIKSLSQQINDLIRDRLVDQDKIKRQAIVSDQLQHELARTMRTEGAMKNLMEEYKKEYQRELNALLEEAHRMRSSLPDKEREAVALVEELRETRDKMKWVMAQKKRQENGE